MQNTTDKKDLIFNYGHNGEGYFVLRSDKEHYEQVSAALNAETWGGLEAELPKEDFEEFMDEYEACNGERPEPGDPFDTSMMPYSEDVYPLELYRFIDTSDDILPKDFVEKYGERVGGPGVGIWLEFSGGKAEEMRGALEAKGFKVEIDPELLDLC